MYSHGEVFGPLFEFSNQFAQFLLEDVVSGTLHGHHETVVQCVLMGHGNLTFVDLPPPCGLLHSLWLGEILKIVPYGLWICSNR
jgi:hypothetical protein